jgi:hypothetical protein
MCRRYDDYGSVTRDRAEGNLNSLDFGEFCEHNEESHKLDGAKTVSKTNSQTNRHLSNSVDELHAAGRQHSLMAIAQFERASMALALDKLGGIVDDAQVMSKVRPCGRDRHLRTDLSTERFLKP